MLETYHNFISKIQNTKNYLLVKDDVGKSKPVTRDLPSSHFSYGVKISKDREDARAVISSWAENMRRAEKKEDQDFRRLNILSVGEKKVTAAQQREFRRLANHRRMSSVEPKSAECSSDVAYGMPLRPSTPMKAVLGNFYAHIAAEKTHFMYSDKGKSIGMQTRTRSVDKAANKAEKELFKMKKFLKVQARTSTRRNKSVTS